MTREELTRHWTRLEEAELVLDAWQEAQDRLDGELAALAAQGLTETPEGHELARRARRARNQARTAQDRVDYLRDHREAERPGEEKL